MFNQDTDEKQLLERIKYKGCDARYMPIPSRTPAWFGGYKNVTIISLLSKNPITIEIINQEIADSFKAYFEEFWKQSIPFSESKHIRLCE